MYNKEEIFEYLDELRESGETNMFGASNYLMNRFGMDRAEARKYVKDWMASHAK